MANVTEEENMDIATGEEAHDENNDKRNKSPRDEITNIEMQHSEVNQQKLGIGCPTDQVSQCLSSFQNEAINTSTNNNIEKENIKENEIANSNVEDVKESVDTSTEIMEKFDKSEEETVSEVVSSRSDIPNIVVTSASPLLAELMENDSTESSTDSSESIPWQEGVVSNVSTEARDDNTKKDVVTAIGNVLAKRMKLNSGQHDENSENLTQSLAQKNPDQKENIRPNGKVARKPRVFVIEDTDAEDIYVTNGNNMVSAKTGRLLQTFQNNKRNGRGPFREPGEIVNSKISPEKSTNPVIMPQEDYTWVTRLRELYGKLKLPADITAELDQYWKNLDKLDQNIARREVDLIELKGQKKWMVTMLARTLESYPIPGQKQQQSPRLHQQSSQQYGYNVTEANIRPFKSPQKPPGQRIQSAPDVRFDPRFHPVQRSVGGFPPPTEQGQAFPVAGFQPIIAKRKRDDPHTSPMRQWPTKPVPTKGVMVQRDGHMAPPPAHIKTEETISPGGVLTGPPPAHTGDRSYGIHRPATSTWRQPSNEYWTNYFQAYQYEQNMLEKQNMQQWTKMGPPLNVKKASFRKVPRDGKTNESTTSPKQSIRDLSFKEKESMSPDKMEPQAKAAANMEAYFQQLMAEGTDTTQDKVSVNRTNQEAKTVPCAVCKSPAIHVCSGCANMWYCSEACQMTGWKTHGKECSKQVNA